MTQTITRAEVDARLPTNPRPSPASGLRRRLLLGDLIAMAAGWIGVLILAPAFTGAGAASTRLLWALAAIAANVTLLWAQDLYLARACMVRAVELQGIGRSVVGTTLALVGVEQLIRAELPLREVWLAGLAAFTLLATARMAFTSWLQQERRAGRFVRDLVMVGADADAVELAAVTREHSELGFRVCGYVGREGFDDALQAPRLGMVMDAADAVDRTNATGVVVIASALEPDALNALVRELLNRNIRVHLSSGLRGIAQHRFRATPLAYEPLFFIEPASLTRWQALCKRTIDVVGATVGLAVTAPLLMAAAIAIKFDSPGPVLFRQQRIGRHGESFTFYKLRTMVTDAESRQLRLESSNQRTAGPLFKLDDDPRVTGIGRLLRASSIDELPQLYNVLRGSMSLVGPRPALPSEVAQFDDHFRTRATVAPGLSGLWQIEARDNPSFGPYRRLDLFYVENWSPLLDIGIIITTMLRVCARALRLTRSSARARATAVEQAR